MTSCWWFEGNRWILFCRRLFAPKSESNSSSFTMTPASWIFGRLPLDLMPGAFASTSQASWNELRGTVIGLQIFLLFFERLINVAFLGRTCCHELGCKNRWWRSLASCRFGCGISAILKKEGCLNLKRFSFQCRRAQQRILCSVRITIAIFLIECFSFYYN